MTPTEALLKEIKVVKVLLWQMKHTSSFDQLVLWDGENTYWTDEMKPSAGYKNIRTHWSRRPMSARLVVIGEL